MHPEIREFYLEFEYVTDVARDFARQIQLANHSPNRKIILKRR